MPQIAGMRPTSRQRMQKLADELAEEGLVKFVDNPKHLRSKLVQLTPKGEDLRPIMRAMVDWGVRHAGGRQPQTVSPSS